MPRPFFLFATLLASCAAQAELPALTLRCNGIHVESRNAGSVLIEGQPALLKKFNKYYYEARSHAESLTVSFRLDDKADWQIRYSGRHRVSGHCQTLAHEARATELPASLKSGKRACLNATARKTGASPGSLIVKQLTRGDEGSEVRIERDTQTWLCRVDSSGRVLTVRRSPGTSFLKPGSRPDKAEGRMFKAALVRKILT